MNSRNVVDRETSAAAMASVDQAVHGVVRLAAQVPGARRWWTEPIPRGIELHAEVTDAEAPAWAGETRIAAGAGLFAVHLAMAALRTRPATTLLPHSSRAGLLAVVRQGDTALPTPVERTLYAVLLGAPVPEAAELSAVQPFLRRAAEAEGVWSHSAVGTGSGTGSGTDSGPALRAVLVDRPGVVAEPGPDDLLVLLASAQDLPVCQLRAGRAVQRILLTARAFGHPGVVLAGPRRLDRSKRTLLAAGIDPAVVPQALLAISPAGRPAAGSRTG